MTTTPRLRDDDPIPPGIIRRVSLGVIVVGIVVSKYSTSLPTVKTGV